MIDASRVTVLAKLAVPLGNLISPMSDLEKIERQVRVEHGHPLPCAEPLLDDVHRPSTPR
jgi:hypothetical protein